MSCGKSNPSFRAEFGEPQRVLPQLEDAAVVNALALEDAAGVVHRMRQYVDPSVPPRRHRAVHPDEAIAVIVWDEGHETLPFLGSLC